MFVCQQSDYELDNTFSVTVSILNSNLGNEDAYGITGQVKSNPLIHIRTLHDNKQAIKNMIVSLMVDMHEMPFSMKSLIFNFVSFFVIYNLHFLMF